MSDTDRLLRECGSDNTADHNCNEQRDEWDKQNMDFFILRFSCLLHITFGLGRWGGGGIIQYSCGGEAVLGKL